MDLHVTIRAIGVLRVQVMLWASRFYRADIVRSAVTCQTKLCHAAGRQQARIGGAVRRMTGDASFSLNRGVLENEGTLLIRMTFDTSGINASCKSRLFEFKAPVRIMTITALHRAFENLVMERQVKLVLYFSVAAQAKLRLAVLQQFQGREGWLFSVGR